MVVYRIRHPIVVARQIAPGRFTTEKLPIGTLLKLAYQPRSSGVVQALWESQVVLAFAHDLLANAEPIPPKAP